MENRLWYHWSFFPVVLVTSSTDKTNNFNSSESYNIFMKAYENKPTSLENVSRIRDLVKTVNRVSFDFMFG